jgi:hypothetical protein
VTFELHFWLAPLQVFALVVSPRLVMHFKLLNGLNFESKGEDNERIKSWGKFFNSQHSGGRGVC